MNDKKISMNNISKIIWKNIVIIFVMTILFGLCGALYAKHKQHTTYESVRNIMTGRSYNGSVANEELQADINLGKTYAKIVESKDVASAARNKLSKKLRKQYSTDQISSMIDAEPLMQTTIIKVSAKADNPHSSSKIVNAVTEAAAKKIPQKVSSAGKVSLFQKLLLMKQKVILLLLLRR